MKLEDFCQINPTVQLNRNEEYEFVEMADLVPGDRYVISKNKKVFNGSFSKFSNKDTLMAKITPCLENGKISQYIGASKAFGSTEFNIFREKENISDANYLYYLVSSTIVKDPAIKSMSGATGRQRANLDEIKQINVPDFNIATQEKIAKILSNYDDLIENNNKRIKILEEMAQKIYKEWFVDFKFPNHETVTFKQTDLGSEVMPIKGKNITKAIIKKGNVPVVAGGIEPAYYHNIPNTVAPVITVSASGANAGYINLYYQDIWASDCSYIDTTMTPYVYYYYLLLKYNQIKVTNMQRGAAQPHVYPQDLAQLKIKIPEENIIREFNEIITPFFSEISNFSLKNQTLKQTRDLLLPRLISGEIDVENMWVK